MLSDVLGERRSCLFLEPVDSECVLFIPCARQVPAVGTCLQESGKTRTNFTTEVSEKQSYGCLRLLFSKALYSGLASKLRGIIIIIVIN